MEEKKEKTLGETLHDTGVLSTLAQIIIVNRMRNELTQQELADKTGIAQKTISMYENNKIKPRMRNIKLISNALNVPMEEFENAIALSEAKGNKKSLNSALKELAAVKNENISLRKELSRYRKMIDAIPDRLEKLLGNIKREVMPLALPNITAVNY